MSIKQLFVFPLLPSEVQALIIPFCSTYSLLSLSSANKSAFEYLPNVNFFQKHYFEQHPLLKPYDKLYTVLLTTHPSNCWKVMCKVMDAQWGPMNSSFANRVRPEFLEEAHPKNVERINTQIKAWEEKNKEICGSYFEDPSSPIDKTWKELDRCAQDCVIARIQHDDLSKQKQDEVELAMKEKNLQLDVDQLKMIVDQFDGGAEAFVSSSYEEFLENSPDENPAMSGDLFALYQKIIRDSLSIDSSFENYRRLRDRSYEFSHQYFVLEKLRGNVANKLAIEKRRLHEYQSNPAKIHLAELTEERFAAMMIERNLKSKYSLDKCLSLVKTLVNHPEEKTPEAFQQVQDLINACHDDYRIKVWSQLYFQCASRAIEDSWAEKHFKDHLRTLSTILAEVAFEAKAYVVTVAPEYMSNPPDWSSPDSANDMANFPMNIILIEER